MPSPIVRVRRVPDLKTNHLVFLGEGRAWAGTIPEKDIPDVLPKQPVDYTDIFSSIAAGTSLKLLVPDVS